MALGLFGFALAVSAAGLFGWRVWRRRRLEFCCTTGLYLISPSPPSMTTASRGDLPIIQATMDLIQWFVPLLKDRKSVV